jgi:hypothetical protein
MAVGHCCFLKCDSHSWSSWPPLYYRTRTRLNLALLGGNQFMGGNQFECHLGPGNCAEFAAIFLVPR